MADLLRFLPITESTFFYWKRQFSKPDKDYELKDCIMHAWQSDRHLGVVRMTRYLLNEFNLIVNHKKVYRLMKELGIYGEGYHKKTRKYDSSKGPEGIRIKNRLNRRFSADRPYQKMVSDVTEFKLPKTQEKVYLEPVMDLYNNEILSYAITFKSPTLAFALSPLKKLIKRLPTVNYKQFLHTDQEWQYRHRSWQRQLRKAGLTPSMSRRATCLDNACIESFFNKLKVEIGDLKHFDSAKALEQTINKWILYYNTKRIQMKLGGQSPIKYRQLVA